jgi:hypothetical protein
MHPNRSLWRFFFTPSVAAVVSISAPQMLLSDSLFSLLTALGIYFGFTWTRSLDSDAGYHDSRNVFIFYIVGLAVCIVVYSVSGIIQDEDKRTEYRIIQRYCDDWIKANEDHVRSWGFSVATDPETQKLNLERVIAENSLQSEETAPSFTQLAPLVDNVQRSRKIVCS